MLKRVSLLVAAMTMLVLGACAPMKSSNTANTANGHTKCVQTSRGLECNADSEKQFDTCLQLNTQQMGLSGADAYCRCVTTGGQVIPSQNPAFPPTCVPTNGAGMVGGGMMGGGYGMQMMPGRYAGYPGSAVVMYPDPTPQGVIAMENAGIGGRTYPMPGSNPGAQPGPTQQDVEDLARSQAAQQAAHCKHFPNDSICCTSCKK